MKESIEDINHEIINCKHCRLCRTRTHAVCGEGMIPAKFMFIAQAPGRTEDKVGKLLIGPSGKIFDKLIGSVNLNRDEIYITNLIKCFLPNCRKPRQDEIETCHELYLRKEIVLVKPEIIVTLGYHVTKFIFKLYNLKVPDKIGLKTTFGKLFVAKNQKIVPLRHPATVVHKSKKLEKLIDEYQILKILQTSCQYIPICEVFSEYKSGLIPVDFTKQYCYGHWITCSQYNKLKTGS